MAGGFGVDEVLAPEIIETFRFDDDIWHLDDNQELPALLATIQKNLQEVSDDRGIAPAPISPVNSIAVTIVTMGPGNDSLFGGDGGDTLNGGGGNDYIDTNGGTNLAYGGDGHDTIYGGPGNDTLDGGNGNDFISSAGGHDVMFGGDGDDEFVLNGPISGTPIPSEIYGGEGDDLIQTNLRTATINGGAGSDIFVKSSGSIEDIAISNVEVLVTLEGGNVSGTVAQFEAFSTIRGSLDPADAMRWYTSVSLVGGGAINLADELDSRPTTIRASNAGNNITSGAGNDYLYGSDESDILNGGAGNDFIDAGSGTSDRIFGGLGEDNLFCGYGLGTVDGGQGNDLIDARRASGFTLIGGSGNDTYLVVSGVQDTIIELSSGGYDRVESGASYTLAANIEHLMLTGSSAINGTGNGTANRISGNSAANVLQGGGGVDTLSGMYGNDTYIADGKDMINEYENNGTDTVQSSGTFTLANYLENLTLTGSDKINGTGNSLSNQIIGNSAGNTLNGGAGKDSLGGGFGNDIYITDGGDTISESTRQGTDTVRTSVTLTLGANIEYLILTGSAAINGTGNTIANTIVGNAAANMLNGALGSDTLTGGGGADTFIFSTAINGGGMDTITDFNVDADKIRLENAIFTGLAAGSLPMSAFVANTSGNAVDAADRIIYDKDSGHLYFDKDGNGSAAKVLFADLASGLLLTSADFLVG